MAILVCSDLPLWPPAGMMSHPPIPISELGEHTELLKANDNLRLSQEYEVTDERGGLLRIERESDYVWEKKKMRKKNRSKRGIKHEREDWARVWVFNGKRMRGSRKREAVINSKVTLAKLISPYSHAATQWEPLETVHVIQMMFYWGLGGSMFIHQGGKTAIIHISVAVCSLWLYEYFCSFEVLVISPFCCSPLIPGSSSHGSTRTWKWTSQRTAMLTSLPTIIPESSSHQWMVQLKELCLLFTQLYTVSIIVVVKKLQCST